MQSEIDKALAVEPAKMPPALLEVQSYAAVFIKSGMFKDTSSLAQGIVKIMYGRELGIPELTAMRHISFVEGKPELDAALIASQIKKSDRYDYKVKNWSVTGCTVEIIEKVGGKRSIIGEATFDKDDAQQANLLHKDNWRKYPKSMYFARTIALAARTYCPDIFMGAVYATGEMSENNLIYDATPVQDDPQSPAAAEEGEVIGQQELPAMHNLAEKSATNLMDVMEMTPPQRIEAFKAAYGRATPPHNTEEWELLYQYLREVGTSQDTEDFTDGEN